jgi:F-type H+-transporting ATPase subunit gamma
MSLKLIKAKIKSVKKIRQVTKAMEAVSAVKMRKSQQRALATRPYAEAALSILAHIAKADEAATHPLLLHTKSTQSSRTLLVVITADRGLAGALNSALLRQVSQTIATYNLTPENCEIVSIGRKGREFLERRGYTISHTYERWGEGVPLGSPTDVIDAIVAAYTQGAFGRAIMVYTNFIATFKQEPVARQLLPVSVPDLIATINGIVPESGKYADTPMSTGARAQYVFEPSMHAVLDILLRQLLSIELYHAVLESNASEHSARMVAMKTASDRARDLTKELTLAFNKARQGAITSEISELVGSQQAMG